MVNAKYGTGHMQQHTREQILTSTRATTSEHMHHQVRVLGGNCIGHASGRANTRISCYHTNCCEHHVKIIASFNYHVIPSIISRDEYVGTFGSGILGNNVVLRDNGE